jgi:hypothetical protein
MDFWRLVVSYWLLAFGGWLLAVGYWLFYSVAVTPFGRALHAPLRSGLNVLLFAPHSLSHTLLFSRLAVGFWRFY